jgi:hypothetical protein
LGRISLDDTQGVFNGFPERWKALAVDRDEDGNSRSQRNDHRPDTAHGGERGFSPTFFRQKRSIESGQHPERHQKIDGDNDEERKGSKTDRRRNFGELTVGDLGRIEALGNGGPLANKFIVRDGAGGFCFPSEALASFTRRGFRASEPLQPETQHDDSVNDPVTSCTQAHIKVPKNQWLGLTSRSWLPFLNTYRTMCLMSPPEFRRFLEKVSDMKVAA